MAAPRRIRPLGPMIGGLPSYTPGQLHQVRPDVKYPVYRRYLQNQRRSRTTVPPVAQGPLTLNSLIGMTSVETPAQIQARVNQMTATQTAAQTGIVNDQAKRAREQALRAMTAQSAAGRAAAALNQDLFGKVGGEYNAAAQELSGLATGGVSDVTDRTAANTAATNEALARVGMPGIDPRMAGPEQAAVAKFRSGLGAQNLVQSGEAANFGLAGLVGSQNLRATQEAVAGQNKSNQDILNKQTDALAEIARGRPDIAAKYLTMLQDANRQQIALASSLLTQQRAAQQQGFTQKMTKAQLALNKKNAQLAQDRQDMLDAQNTRELQAKLGQIDIVRSAAAGYVVDTEGKPILQNGERIPYSKIEGMTKSGARPGKGKGAKTPAYTPNQLANLMQKGSGVLENMFYGYVADPRTGKRIPLSQMADFDPNTDPRKYFTPEVEGAAPTYKAGQRPTGLMSYTQAATRLLNMGLPGPFVKSLLDEKYIRGGARGRPWLSEEERKRAVKAFGADQVNFGIKQATDLMKRGQFDLAEQTIEALLNGEGYSWVNQPRK